MQELDAPNVLAETMKALCRNVWMLGMVALGAYMEVHHADISFPQAFGGAANITGGRTFTLPNMNWLVIAVGMGENILSGQALVGDAAA